MPSLPSLRRLPLRELRRQPWRRIVAAAILGVLLAAGSACKSAPPPPVRGPVQRSPEPLALAPADRPYLIDPLEGYSRAVDPELRERLETAWHGLLEEGDTATATHVTAELLAREPDFAAAQVLAAQVDFAAGENAHVVERLL